MRATIKAKLSEAFATLLALTAILGGGSVALILVGLRWRRECVRSLVRTAEAVIVLPDLPAIFATHLGIGDAHTAEAA